MNKNLAIALGGTVVFLLAFILMWGIGQKGDDKTKTGPLPGGQNAGQQKPVDPPVKPVPDPGPVKPPVEPGPGPVVPPVKPDPDPVKPPVDPGPGPGPDASARVEPVKPRISFDSGTLDEAKRVEAAGKQEIPMPWLQEPKQGEAPKPPVKYPTTFKVEKAMSLYRVAEIVYGNAEKWNLLFQANKAMLEDPEKVEAGTVLRVPDPAGEASPSPKKKGAGITEGVF